jgi:hypothetical protein
LLCILLNPCHCRLQMVAIYHTIFPRTW